MRLANRRFSTPQKALPQKSLPMAFLHRALKAAPLAVMVLAVSPAQAQREDQGLQLGCANDYFRLCAGVDPNSQDADRCMERNRGRLSPECRNAIGDYDKRSGRKSKKSGDGE